MTANNLSQNIISMLWEQIFPFLFELTRAKGILRIQTRAFPDVRFLSGVSQNRSLIGKITSSVIITQGLLYVADLESRSGLTDETNWRRLFWMQEALPPSRLHVGKNILWCNLWLIWSHINWLFSLDIQSQEKQTQHPSKLLFHPDWNRKVRKRLQRNTLHKAEDLNCVCVCDGYESGQISSAWGVMNSCWDPWLSWCGFNWHTFRRCRNVAGGKWPQGRHTSNTQQKSITRVDEKAMRQIIHSSRPSRTRQYGDRRTRKTISVFWESSFNGRKIQDLFVIRSPSQ